MNFTQKLRYFIKFCFAYLVYFTGFLFIYRTIVLNGKAIVLMYHRVLNEQDIRKTNSSVGIVVSDTTFKKHLQFIRKRFEILSAAEFVNHFRQKRTFHRAAALITFDDGWIDNFIYAFPILKEFQLPALIFLSTNYIGTHDLFWQEKLRSLIKILTTLIKEDPQFFDTNAHVFSDIGLKSKNFSQQSPEIISETIISTLKSLPEKKRESIIKNLEGFTRHKNENNNEIDRFMSWEQVAEMAAGGVDFGSHTMNHTILTQIDQNSINEEISGSKKLIENKVGKPIDSFSYPNGDFTPIVKDLVRESGYYMAFTTQPGAVDISCDVLEIKRINIHEDMTRSVPMFYCKLLGIL